MEDHGSQGAEKIELKNSTRISCKAKHHAISCNWSAVNTALFDCPVNKNKHRESQSEHSSRTHRTHQASTLRMESGALSFIICKTLPISCRTSSKSDSILLTLPQWSCPPKESKLCTRVQFSNQSKNESEPGEDLWSADKRSEMNSKHCIEDRLQHSSPERQESFCEGTYPAPEAKILSNLLMSASCTQRSQNIHTAAEVSLHPAEMFTYKHVSFLKKDLLEHVYTCM